MTFRIRNDIFNKENYLCISRIYKRRRFISSIKKLLKIIKFTRNLKINSGKQGNMGWSVSINKEGSVISTGCPKYGDNDNGIICIYEKQNEEWINTANIEEEHNIGSNKGTSIVLNKKGDCLLFGCPGTNEIFFYKKINGIWVKVQNIKSPLEEINISFGSKLTSDDDFNNICISAVKSNENRGSVYIYKQIDGIFVYVQTIECPSNAIGNPSFGYSIKMSSIGNRLFISGINDNNNTGAVWVFTKNNEIYEYSDKLISNDVAPSPNYQGFSLSCNLDGTILFIGIPNDYSGSVRVLTYENNSWIKKGIITVDDPTVTGFGIENVCSTDGNVIMISSILDDSNEGYIWMFKNIDGVYQQDCEKFRGDNVLGYPQQGFSMSCTEDASILIAGGPFDNDTDGAIWIFS